ncbi:MAG: 2-oxoacid:acceptor oxidoreductase family protein [Deltaproteobacteria bacterium]|jgi:2-oxoglutarate ferredoxin oxidoreductase subunit gamma|nr:2-oxoacid:acceptor oxidoreductase family protein [Deltaproteobacteria bacterium]
MTHSIIFSGFGGQGIMLMGQLLTQAGMHDGRKVSWIPSYGPEMRGGTAYCCVTISDEPIGSPVVTEPTLVVAMNLPSVTRFAPQVLPGGMLIINSSLAPEPSSRTDITQIRVPMNQLADELNNPKVLNMIGLGVVVAAAKPVTEAAMLKGMDVMLGKKFAGKPKLLELNRNALRKGMEQVR